MKRVPLIKKRHPNYDHPPHLGKGRPKGSPNKFNLLLKDAVLRAASLTGYDKKGKEGLVGYLRMMAEKYPQHFTSSLLARILPLQVTGKNDGPIQIVSLDASQLAGMQGSELENLEITLAMAVAKAAGNQVVNGAKVEDEKSNAYEATLH